MHKTIMVSAAQMGPNQESDTREAIVERMVTLLDQAADMGVELLVFPEMALTSYFPKRIRDDYDHLFETAMPNPAVQPLFDRAKKHGIAFYLGYAEKTPEGRHFNSAILVDERGELALRYRKIHLPGQATQAPAGQTKVYEPHFFDVGDTGLRTVSTQHGHIGMALCQDRRYSETYRVLGLEGAEIILIGYNTPSRPLGLMQSELVLRAGAYENSVFVVASAKAGVEDGLHMMGGSCVVDPQGQVIARASTEGDELVTTRLDLGLVDAARQQWSFYRRRRPEAYGALTNPQIAASPAAADATTRQ